MLTNAPPQAIRFFLCHLRDVQEDVRVGLPDYVWLDQEQGHPKAITPVPWFEIVKFWQRLALGNNDWAKGVSRQLPAVEEAILCSSGQQECLSVTGYPWHEASDGGLVFWDPV
mgnify:FL=1